MIIQIVRLKSNLPEDELLKRANERAPQFEAIPGLIQKFYAKRGEPGGYAGLYVWDSMESIQAFRASELAQSIPSAYEVIEAPDIELMDVLFKLRED